ncbi:hypothetical protein [Niabella aquatica]
MKKPEDRIKTELSALSELESVMLDCAKELLNAGNSFAHKLDFLALSVLNRAIALNKGFLLLFEYSNYLTAFSLMRLQLDNALRFFATVLVEDGVDFLDHFLGGNRIDKYKVGKNKLTDAFLAQELDKLYPGTYDLYKYLSTYIHLSNTHFEKTKSESDNESALFRVTVGEFDSYTIQEKIDYIENMLSISIIIIQLVNNWIQDKDLFVKISSKEG